MGIALHSYPNFDGI